MAVEAIGGPEQLTALRPEWEALWRRCPAATPFQHPDWLLPWWNIFGSGELFTFAVRDGGRLIALAPLFVHSWKGRRQVTLIGNGISDYLDFLAEPDAAAEACRAILNAVADSAQGWELCDFQDLRSGSVVVQNCCNGEALALGLRSQLSPQGECSAIPLPDTPGAYHDSLPHGLRRNLRRYRSLLDSFGPVVCETATEGTFREFLEALFALHQARWHEMKAQQGMFAGAGITGFHTRSAANLFRHGLVRLHALRLRGQICAIVYLLAHRGRAYSYLGGFSPELARCSPGALVLHYAIQCSILEGIREYDFLRGSEPYKKDWGARELSTYRLALTPIPA